MELGYIGIQRYFVRLSTCRASGVDGVGMSLMYSIEPKINGDSVSVVV